MRGAIFYFTEACSLNKHSAMMFSAHWGKQVNVFVRGCNVFTCMSDDSYRRRFRPSLCPCDVFPTLIISLCLFFFVGQSSRDQSPCRHYSVLIMRMWVGINNLTATESTTSSPPPPPPPPHPHHTHTHTPRPPTPQKELAGSVRFPFSRGQKQHHLTEMGFPL